MQCEQHAAKLNFNFWRHLFPPDTMLRGSFGSVRNHLGCRGTDCQLCAWGGRGESEVKYWAMWTAPGTFRFLILRMLCWNVSSWACGWIISIGRREAKPICLDVMLNDISWVPSVFAFVALAAAFLAFTQTCETPMWKPPKDSLKTVWEPFRTHGFSLRTVEKS